MITSRSLLRAIAAFAMVASVAGCSGDADVAELEAEVAELRADVQDRRFVEDELIERLEAAETDLDNRFSDLEAALDGPADEDDGPRARIDELDEELARLGQALTVLEEQVEDSASRAEFEERLETTDQELRSLLADVRDDLDSVRGTVELLSDQLEVLRDRVDRAGG